MSETLEQLRDQWREEAAQVQPYIPAEARAQLRKCAADLDAYLTRPEEPGRAEKTCETAGHLFGYDNRCIFCREPIPDELASYLTEGETPLECIKRNRADIDVLLTLLADEKQRNKQAHPPAEERPAPPAPATPEPATCATCQWWDGHGRNDGHRHRCLAHDGVTELMFAEQDVLWTKAEFGCVVHQPTPPSAPRETP